jgi:hypothetical protein
VRVLACASLAALAEQLGGGHPCCVLQQPRSLPSTASSASGASPTYRTPPHLPTPLHPPAVFRFYCCPAGGGPAWKIEHENKGKWINPLIGWTSTADPLENVGRQLYFASKADAIAFAGGVRLGDLWVPNVCRIGSGGWVWCSAQALHVGGCGAVRCRELQRKAVQRSAGAWQWALRSTAAPGLPAPRHRISCAEKNGWEYEVEDYHTPSKARPKRYQGYGDK